MNDEDFHSVIGAIQRNFVLIGAPELADDAMYVFRDTDADEWRLLPLRERAVAMLEAFDRYMAVRDQTTFRDALRRMQENSTHGFPRGATFTPVTDGAGIESRESALSQAPDLSEARIFLRTLISQLREEPLEKF